MDELGFQQLSDDQIHAICSAMGVPSHLLGGETIMSVSEGLFFWALLEALKHPATPPAAPAGTEAG